MELGVARALRRRHFVLADDWLVDRVEALTRWLVAVATPVVRRVAVNAVARNHRRARADVVDAAVRADVADGGFGGGCARLQITRSQLKNQVQLLVETAISIGLNYCYRHKSTFGNL